MKNYTTKEQSKRLIELGVPENSADCYYTEESNTPNWIEEGKKYSEINISDNLTPCWSIGQIINVLSESYKLHSSFSYVYDLGNRFTCDEWVKEVEFRIEDNTLNFKNYNK